MLPLLHLVEECRTRGAYLSENDWEKAFPEKLFKTKHLWLPGCTKQQNHAVRQQLGCDLYSDAKIEDGQMITSHDGKTLMSWVGTGRTIVIDRSIEIIYEYFCFGEKKVKNVVWDEICAVKEIGRGAFMHSGLRSIIIPKSVEKIGRQAFYDCRDLARIEFEEGSLKEIEKCAFFGVRKDWRLREAKTCLEICIPGSVEVLGTSAFSHISPVLALTFQEGSRLKRIGKRCFFGSVIRSVTIPRSVEVIEMRCFCASGLEHLAFEAQSALRQIDRDAFASTYIKEVEIPRSVEILGDNAFFQCKMLNSVIFEEGSKLKQIGMSAFGSTPIERIEIPKSVETLNQSFGNCGFLQKVTFEKGSALREIGDGVFEDKEVLEIVIPKHVTRLGNKAFMNCRNLQNLTFEEGSELREIGEFCFHGCFIKHVCIPGSVEMLKKSCFGNCELHKVMFEKDCKLREIGERAFASCECLVEVEIPRSVEVVGARCFAECEGLKRVTVQKYSALKEVGEAVLAGTPIFWHSVGVWK
jgi:hypothetical protein